MLANVIFLALPYKVIYCDVQDTTKKPMLHSFGLSFLNTHTNSKRI